MINFYVHTGSGNHGCEAIVRASKKILDKDINLFSINPTQDKEYGIDKICTIIEDNTVNLKKYSLKRFVSSLQTKLTKSVDLNIRYRRENLLKHISSNDVCFSIGGDNYCYPGTDILASVNRNIKRKKSKMILWGCSVEPDLLKNNEIAKDIASYDLITARETISYNALKKVNPNTILVSDPAFVLDKVDLPLPEGWIEGNMVGINVSPLIMRSNKNSKMVLDAYRKLIEYIICQTSCNIALIPHVVWESNDDRISLSQLYQEFKNTKRVIMIEDHNCMELKGYISRCRFFIGARTHATIAAYSTCVPTLVLGYSVKSRGIAKDLFGTSENYVLPVQQLTHTDELANGFEWLLKNESKIREHLEKIMPEYINKAYLGKEAVNKLI